MNESPTRINSTSDCTDEYCFEVKVGDNTLTLITGDILLGREAKQVVQEHFAKKIKSPEKGITNERSITSGNNSPANSSMTSSVINDSNVTRRTTRLTSNLRNIRVVVKNDKRSSTELIDPETDSNSCVSGKSISKSFCLTYDRDFLFSLKDKLMCRQEPIYFDRIVQELPSIIKRDS